jgi:hypothetical protein
LLTGPLILLLVSLTLLAGVLIALTLLAGVLSAALLSGVLSTLILLAGILIGLVRIFRIVHSNAPFKLSLRITRLVVSHRCSGKSCVKNRQRKRHYFTGPLLAPSAATSKMRHAEKYSRWI